MTLGKINASERDSDRLPITPFVFIRLTPQAPWDGVGRDAPGVSSIFARG